MLMKELLFLIGGIALLSILIPQTVDAGMYGEVYIPDHEFIGFYDETETYTCLLYTSPRPRD